MSDTVKLIIEIPREKLNIIKNKMYCGIYDPDLYKAIADGTPLDDVKAEIEKEENIWYHDCEPENDWKKFDVIRVDTVFEILNNIGNAESEE
jgi:hypothetical protein